MSKMLFQILFVTLLCKNGFGNSRINQGHNIDIKDAPYMARVRIKISQTVGGACGGSIISDTYILTAGHCVTDGSNRNVPNPPIYGPSNFSILIGATDLDYPEQGEEFTVSKVFFRAFTSENDIALLKLSSPIKFDGKTKMAVTLPTDAYYSPKNRTDAYVDGWGTNPQKTYHLLRANVYTITVEECNRDEPDRNRTYQICTFGIDGAGPCEGDSGGPMLRATDGIQIGIVSFGPNADCDDPTRGSSVFSSVSRNLPWIQCTMLENGANDQCEGITSSKPAIAPMNILPITTTTTAATATTTRRSPNLFGFPFHGFLSSLYN